MKVINKITSKQDNLNELEGLLQNNIAELNVIYLLEFAIEDFHTETGQCVNAVIAEKSNVRSSSK